MTIKAGLARFPIVPKKNGQFLLYCLKLVEFSYTQNPISHIFAGISYILSQTWAEAGFGFGFGFGFTKPAFLGSRLRLPRFLGAWLRLRLRLRDLQLPFQAFVQKASASASWHPGFGPCLFSPIVPVFLRPKVRARPVKGNAKIYISWMLDHTRDKTGPRLSP